MPHFINFSLFLFRQNRADVFTNLLNSGDVTNVSVDTTQTEKLLRLLDTVVIRLEGGTDEDLKVLDEKPVEPKQFEQKFEPPPRPTNITKSTDDDIAITKPPGRPNNPFAKKIEDIAPSGDFNWKTSKNISSNQTKNDDEEDWDADSDDGKNVMPSSPDKKQDDDDDWIENKNKTETGNKGWDDDPASPDQKDQLSSPEVNEKQIDWDEDKNQVISLPEQKVPTPRKRSRSESSSSSTSSDSDIAEPTPKPIQEPVDNEEEVNEPKDEEMKTVEDIDSSGPVRDPETSDEKVETDAEKTNTDDVEKDDSKVEDKVETIDLDKESDTKEEGPTHKALHRTSSIFLRNLAPTITKAEVEAMCKRYNGFLRVAIADPLVERRWFRRGWVTFERDVNIKEICWNLNNIRLRDCELGAIVSPSSDGFIELYSFSV